MALQQYLGKLRIGSASKDFAIGASACSLTVGDYYLTGYTAEATAQLCEHMQAVIRAIGATQDASTVVYNATTGRVTITLETAAALTWTDAALGALLGYTSAAYGAGTTFTAEAAPRYVWRPTEGLARYPVHLSTWWGSRSTTVVQRSPNGSIATVEGAFLYDGEFGYDLLTSAEVMTTPGTTVWESLEQFWLDVIGRGKPIRCYPDRTLSAVGNVFEAIALPRGDEGLGSFVDYAARHFESYDGLWNVSLRFGKYIAPA